ncbi:uncharacterized protein LOC131428224 isoform X1 [Malaya genurostris]|uniref:uncharacterized protein LOC131428224 isoform X1 n=2 Tax=Malaya genurostris TaxID=325434 RepID=UPI0026F3B560|nr:uncharacterized protein LOC131428224 isoform X1 [Malaya genurostris]
MTTAAVNDTRQTKISKYFQSYKSLGNRTESNIDNEMRPVYISSSLPSLGPFNNAHFTDLESGINNLPMLLNVIEKLPLTLMMKQLVKETVTNTLKNIVKNKAAKGVRYMMETKHIGAYLYLLGGRKDYEELVVNLGLPSVCTVMRHIRKSCDKILEGKLRVKELVQFLQTHNFPKVIFISEDGTKINPRIRYDIERDQIVGFCPNLNENGMPLIDSFSATSPNVIQEYFKNFDKSTIVYVILATPLALKTLSFNLLSFGTNNRFSIEEVLLRWGIIERELTAAGITVVGYGADGDNRLIGSMKIRMGLPRSISIVPLEVPSVWKSWYAARGRISDIYIQDSTHIINKMKNCLLSSTRALQIGKFPASRGHLIAIAKDGKENTGLAESDLEQHDKMSVKSFHKIIDPRVNEWLNKYPGTNATVAFITIMRLVYDSYEHLSLSPLERIKAIWCATFFIRVWHRWVQKCNNLKLEEHFLTDNVELGIELNAHALINYLLFCRKLNRSELLLSTLLNSQHNERSFANARSMTGVQNTVINFDMLEYLNKATRFEYLDELRRKLDGKISFARENYRTVEFENFEFPTNFTIYEAVYAAKLDAQKLLKSVGLKWKATDFECALRSPTRNIVLPLTEFNVFKENQESQLEGSSQVINESNDIDNGVIFEARALLSSLDSDIRKISKPVNDVGGQIAPKGFFTIVTTSGKIMLARKVTVLWLLSSNTTRISNDRLLRYRPYNTAQNNPVLKNENKVQDNLSIGEWFIYLDGKLKIVAQSLGFMFLQGKSKREKECSLKTVPIIPPDGLINPRGIGVVCCKFSYSADGKLYVVSDAAKINIDRYVSHIEKPTLNDFKLTTSCILYISNL